MATISDDTDVAGADRARALIGHLSEYNRLLAVLEAQPGVVVLAADPFSGTTGIVRQLLPELATPAVYADARGILDELDLAMAIADAAVTTLRPAAAAWWTGAAPTTDLEGLRLHRTLSHQGVDIEAVRTGTGTGPHVLDLALELTYEVAGGPVVLALDHLDGVAGGPHRSTGDPLATLRAAAQRLPGLQLLLIGRLAGALERALRDSQHPLYRGGQLERLQRADPSRYVDDLAVARPWTDASVTTIRTAAEITGGVPAYVWSVVDLTGHVDEADEPLRTVAAWRRLQGLTEAHTARQFDALRAVHPIAQPVIAAIAAGLGAYSLPLNDGRIRPALTKLREVGAVWQPRDRDWAVADPLLAAWSRDHAPPWIRRRARATTGRSRRPRG
ncbi:MAG: hypothetical protein MSC31_19200 [Solirubrobacteraceae bacterium MAG38_C4-C5]|nr:hypothetical protein [Candidatus Siliceabacter maunaloa]